MKLVITYCSGPKRRDPGGLPATERYQSERIGALHASAGEDLRILSGEFALLLPCEMIPWYDHLLRVDEVRELAVTVADQLLEWEPEKVEYHTADPAIFPQVKPYLEVMEKACRFAGIPMEVVLLPGYPD